IGSPRADDHEYLELPKMPEDPYVEIVAEDQPGAEDASPTAQSPNYVPESDPKADPEEDPVDYPADGGDDGDDEEGSSEDDEDDDMDIEADDEEEEEHLAPAEFVVVALPATDQVPSAEETKPFETDESAATPPPHPAYRVTARIYILALVPTPLWSDAEIARLLARSTLPSSPLSPWSSPLPQIPSPSLPLSLPSHVLSPAPPPSPIRLRCTIIRDTPTLPISVSYYTSPPLLLPSASRREDIPEVTLPPRKRLGIALRTQDTRLDFPRGLEAIDDAVDLCRAESYVPLRTQYWLRLMQSLQGQVTTLLGHVATLQGQVTVLQGQQGPAGGPAQPELPEEAGSSS
ncbi:hypothetical protein Tco_1249731, partial [Tanacetum coccineum]